MPAVEQSSSRAVGSISQKSRKSRFQNNAFRWGSSQPTFRPKAPFWGASATKGRTIDFAEKAVKTITNAYVSVGVNESTQGILVALFTYQAQK